MIQSVIHNKNILTIMGASLVLLLAVACSSDSEDAMTGANISDFLAATGGSEAAAQLLRYNLGASTGIWVNGTGKATGDPDLGIINLGVESLADTASEARQMAGKAIEQTIAVLKINNIEERDMQTSQFSISPQYNTQEITKCTDISRETGPASPNCRIEFERVLTGYQVTNTLTVKVRNLNNMDIIIDGASEAAGNLIRVNRVSFTIEDIKPLQNQAREEAIADLLSKAATMAELAGVELGKLVYLTESGGSSPQSFARMESASFAMGPDTASSILAGELNVNLNVEAIFGIAR